MTKFFDVVAEEVAEVQEAANIVGGFLEYPQE